MEHVVKTLGGFLWGDWMIVLCLGAGLFFGYKYKFFQLRYLKESVKLTFEKSIKTKEGISSFQAFTLALAGRVGTGNIVGVITAIASGGPGAVFWMWLIAILGAGTSFVECTLAQVYKTKKFGEYRGGPAFYLEKGLGKRWLGVLFALACAIGNILLIPGVHSHAITSSLRVAFGLEGYLGGLLIAVFLAVIIFGNVKRLAFAAEIIVPIMSVGYVLFAVVLVFVNLEKFPAVISMIFSSAWGVNALFGGMLGSAISMGVKRGVNSCSAGMGTAPQSAAAAEVSHPVKQGMVQAISVYIDTLLVCSATAFMVLITDSYNVINPKTGEFVVRYLSDVQEVGAVFVQRAAETLAPNFGGVFIAIALFFFSFTSLMAAYYIGETNVLYFIGKDDVKNKKVLFGCIKVVFLAMVIFGSLRSGGLAWAMNDVGTGFMVWVNLFSILFLSGVVKKVLDDFEAQYKAGKNPVFDPLKIGIANADTWSSPEMRARYDD